jgi:MOSC domain-containing protein YiiM
MTGAQVISVQVGRGKDAAWAGRLGRTAIDKRAVAGPVAVRALGFAGDEQADQDNHGGVDQAVYAYAREDLDWFAERLGRDLRSGMFGENVTTAGLDVSGAAIGETWQLGTAVVQVTSPRIPCGVFRSWMDERGWLKKFAAAARPGAYLRVLTEGEVQAGDPVTVLARPAVCVPVSDALRAFFGDRAAMRRLLALPGLDPWWQGVATRVLGPASPPGDS